MLITSRILIKQINALMCVVVWHRITVVQSTTASTLSPSLMMIVEFVGVTSIDSRLFVLRARPSRQQIQVYDTKSFKQQQIIQVDGLSDDTPLQWTDIVCN
jgi:hypothetical protein